MAKNNNRNMSEKEELFCKYFFYGLENKEEIIRGIIKNISTSENSELHNRESALLQKRKKEKLNEPKIKELLDNIQKDIDKQKNELNSMEIDSKSEEEIAKKQSQIFRLESKLFETKIKIENTVEGETILLNEQILEIENLVIQLERFKTLNDDSINRRYVFEDSDEEKAKAKHIVKEQLEYMKSKSHIYFINYVPMSGIYCSSIIREQKEDWIEEVISVLKDLVELEKTDEIKYYSAFLDAKYSRAISRKETGITKDDDEIKEIKAVYRKFFERIPVLGNDIIANLENPTKRAIKHIKENYYEYDTLTTLRSDAKNPVYQEKLEKEIEKIESMFKPISLEEYMHL